MQPSCFLSDFDGYIIYPKVSLLLSLYVRGMKKIMMTRLSVGSLGVWCNEMIDTPMLLVVRLDLLSRSETLA